MLTVCLTFCCLIHMLYNRMLWIVCIWLWAQIDHPLHSLPSPACPRALPGLHLQPQQRGQKWSCSLVEALCRLQVLLVHAVLYVIPVPAAPCAAYGGHVWRA